MAFARKTWHRLLAVLALIAATVGPLPPTYGQGAEQLAPYYRSVVEAYEANPVDPAARSWEAVDALNGAGIAYRYFGDPQQAWELHQRALVIAREIGDRNREMATLQHLGNTASQLEDDQGITFYQSQIAIVRDRNDLALEAYILQLLSFGYGTIGDTQALLEVYDDYIPLLQRLEQWNDAVYALVAKASLYYGAFSRPQQAFEVLDQAFAIAQQANDADLMRTVLSNQGTFYRLAGNATKVIEVYEQALALKTPSDNYQDRLILQQQLAYAYEGQDRIADAIPLHRANLTLAQQRSDTSWTAWAMDDLSFTYRQLQQYEQALEWQLQGLEQHQQSAYEGESTFSEHNAYNSLGWIYLALGDLPAAERSLQKAIEGYEKTANNVQENQGLFGQSNDDLQVNLREGFADAYRTLQAALVGQGKINEALEVAEQGRARSIVNLLALKTGEAANGPIPKIADLKAIARSHKTTLVAYSILYDQPRITIGSRLRRPSLEKTLLIWVITPMGNVSLRQVDLQQIWQPRADSANFSSTLDTLLQNTRKAMGVSSRGFNVEWRAETVFAQTPISELQLLHKILIEPIADLLPSDPTETVTFIPQDTLFFTPFAALQDPEGRFLIERHTIITAPSIQFLGLTKARQQQLGRLSTTSNALVVGNPTMPQVPVGVNGSLEQLPDLPGAELEAGAIANLLNTQPLIGNSATEAVVANQLPQARIIHLATHGLLDSVYGFQSALALAPGAGEDGLLKTREIINLNLQADLVVLSACDTGRGRLTGDGVIGLARSFIGAGVPSIVVSLWAIPDSPTAELMTEFYQQLDQGKDKAQALRQAMLITLEAHPDPRNWAGFTLIGETD